jgi:hypothetical protein
MTVSVPAGVAVAIAPAPCGAAPAAAVFVLALASCIGTTDATPAAATTADVRPMKARLLIGSMSSS